jgi:hypothetical protein
MKLPQLSLRDLFWLVALVAMGLAWWVREQQLRHEMLVQARISSFFAGELMNQEYLIDWEKESVLLTVPKALQDRVRKSYIRLELGLKQAYPLRFALCSADAW